jgi:pyrroline-5-carboxylate reductase
MKELIKAVASPGGTTEEALKVLDTKGFSSLVAESILAAIKKSKKMSKG